MKPKKVFVWLLNTWLKTMFRIYPKIIIIDQDVVINNVVVKVLPEVNHYFCMWHIEGKKKSSKVPELCLS